MATSKEQFFKDYERVKSGNIKGQNNSALSDKEQFFEDYDRVKKAGQQNAQTYTAPTQAPVQTAAPTTPTQQSNFNQMQKLLNNSVADYEKELKSVNDQISAISGYGVGADRSNLQKLYQQKDLLEKQLKTGRYDEDLTALERVQLAGQYIGESTDATAGALVDIAGQAVKDYKANKSNADYQQIKDREKEINSKIEVIERRAAQGVADETMLNHLQLLYKEKQYLQNTVDEKYKTPLDLETDSMRAMQRALQAREQATYGMSDTAAGIVNLAISMADSASRMPLSFIPGVGNAISSGIMAARVVAEKAYDVGVKGGTAAEALTRGAVSGGIEYFAEKYGLDNLTDIVKSKAGRTFIKDFFENATKNLPEALKSVGKLAAISHKQGKAEMGEEFVSYVLNYLADKMAGDPEAKFSLEDAAASAFGGYVSGYVFGSLGQGVDYVASKSGRNNINTQTNDVANVNDAVNSAENAINSTENAINSTESAINSTKIDSTGAINAKNDRKALENKVKEIVGIDTRTESEKVADKENARVAAAEEMAAIVGASEAEVERVRQSAAENIAEAKAKQKNLDYQKEDADSGVVRQQMLNDGRGKVVDRIEKFAAKRNLKVKYFDADINIDGYGFIEGDTMYLNARSGDKALQKAAIHETIHGLRSNNQEEFDNLFNTIIDYAEQYKGLHDVVNKTLATYSNPKSLAYKGILANDGSGEIDQNKLGEEVLAKLCEEVIDNPAAFIEKVDGDKTLLSSVSEFLRKIKNNLAITLTNSEKAKLDNAVMAIENYIRGKAENNSTKYSVEYDKNGKPFVVIDTDILANVSKKDWVSTVKQALQNRTINMGIFEIAVDSKIRNEYFNSEYSKKIKTHKKDLYKAKLRMANNLDEIVQNAYSVKNEDPKHYPHKFFESFNRATIDVVFGTQGYEIKVVTGINTLNNEIVYDIVDIKKKTVPRSTPIQSTLKKGTVSIDSVTQPLKNDNGNKLSADINKNVVDDLENLSIREKIEAVAKNKGADSRSFNEQRKAKNLLIKQLSSTFGIPTKTELENERIVDAKAELKQFVEDMVEEIKTTGVLSDSTIDGIVDKAFELGVMDIGGRDVSLEDYYGEYSDTVKAEMRKTVVDYTEVFADRINEIANYEASLLARDQERKKMLKKGPISLEEFYEAHKKTYLAEKKLRAVENNALLTEDEKKQVTSLMGGADKRALKGPRKNKIIAVYEAKKAVQEARAPIAQYRAALRNERESVADRALVTFRGWKDKGAKGLAYDTETFERNVRDIVPDKSEAQFIIDTYVKPVHKAEAAATRMKNELRQKVKDLKIDTSNKKLYKITYGMDYKDSAEIEVNESGLVQLLGEGLIDESRIRAVGADFEKIKAATEVFKEIYNDLYKQSNEALLRNGYAPMGKIENYFPHFIEEADTMLSKIAKRAGFEVQTNRIPTDIAGITDTFRPGKKFFGHTLSRTTDTTVYDAVKGFDQYVEGAAAVIYQTDNIQNIRTLENRLRFNAGNAGLKKALLEIDMDNTKSETEKQDAKDKLYEETKSSNLSGFVSYLRRYGDNLAGKKHRGDRGIEDDIGREVYTLSKALESRIASNMIGGNVASALTNFIPITQMTAEVKAEYIFKAMDDTMKAIKSKDSSFEIDSDFLTNRLGSEKVMQNWTQKASKWAGIAMQGIDRFTSNVVVRAKYLQNASEYNMSPEDAMEDANNYAASLLADRSKGALPLIFERKNPLIKAVTMFQVEQNNQLRYLLKDLPQNLKEEGKEKLVVALLKYAVAAWLYNLLYKFLAGRKPAFDPIDISWGVIRDTGKAVTGKLPVSDAIQNAATSVAEEIPFVSGLVGGGRVPISSALPSSEALQLLNREVDKNKKWDIAKKELTKPMYYLGLPTAGGAVKKVNETIGLYGKNKGVQYSVQSDGSKKVQFASEPTVANIAKSAIFGKWSSKEAQEYIDSGFKGLSKKQTKAFDQLKGTGLKNKEATAMVNSVKEADPDKNDKYTQKEAKKWLNSKNFTREQKAILFAFMCPKAKNNPYK